MTWMNSDWTKGFVFRVADSFTSKSASDQEKLLTIASNWSEKQPDDEQALTIEVFKLLRKLTREQTAETVVQTAIELLVKHDPVTLCTTEAGEQMILFLYAMGHGSKPLQHPIFKIQNYVELLHRHLR